MPLPPGGPTAAAFAAAVDDLASYLDAEATAAAASARARGTKRAPAPATGWAWTADRVVRLLQQHAGECVWVGVGAGRTGEGERGRAHAITRSWTLTHPPHTPDGLPHHVLKTALWGDWKQLVSVWLCVCVVF